MLQTNKNDWCVCVATGVWSDLDSQQTELSERGRGRKRKTDMLMTSSVFCVPATRREITVITADQHVHFLTIDALKVPKIAHVHTMRWRECVS